MIGVTAFVSDKVVRFTYVGINGDYRVATLELDDVRDLVKMLSAWVAVMEKPESERSADASWSKFIGSRRRAGPIGRPLDHRLTSGILQVVCAFEHHYAKVLAIPLTPRLAAAREAAAVAGSVWRDFCKVRKIEKRRYSKADDDRLLKELAT